MPLSRSFRLLWAATAISNVGDGLRLTALPLLATSVTTDPRSIAGVALAERIPWLLFILPGGAWADRHDRRVLRMRLDGARAVVMATLVAAIALDRISMVAIYAVAALLASAESVVDSSSMALVPATVDEHQLERAGGLLSSTELVTNALIGPPLGGLLFGLAVAVPFGIDAASFAAAAVTMSLLPGTFRPSGSSTQRPARGSLRREITDGFRWFWSRPPLRNLALVSTALGFADFLGGAVFVLFATQTLGLSSAQFGLLLVPGALGGIAGSVLAGRLTALPLRLVLAASILLAGCSTLAISASSAPVVVGALSALTSATVLVWNVLTVALRQRVVPAELLGRVGASYRFLVYAGMPFGALAGGALAHSFGVRSAIASGGGVLVVVGLAIPYLLRGVQPATDAPTTSLS